MAVISSMLKCTFQPHFRDWYLDHFLEIDLEYTNMPQELTDENNKTVLLCDTVHRTSRKLINPVHPLKFNSWYPESL